MLVLAVDEPPVSLEHDEDLLFRRVNVSRPVPLAGMQAIDVEPGLLGAGPARNPGRRDPEVAAGHPVVPLHGVDVDDVGRARLGLADLGLTGRDLPCPRMVASARLRPGREDPGDVAAWQVGDLQRDARAVDEDVEPVGPARSVCAQALGGWTMQSPGPIS